MTEKTVFIVDDDLDMRTSLRWLIESIGCNVETFGSAEEFLEAGKVDQPGCLILDVRMPGMGGIRLLEHMRKTESRLPTIILTGHGEISMAVQTMKSGAFDFLEKPASPQVILERVRDALRLDAEMRETIKDQRAFSEKIGLLTRREKEVLDHLTAGESTRIVAEKLFISERTIEKHRERILHKMASHSMIELIRQMIEFRGNETRR